MTGCGGGEPFQYVPVSGKVTYDDGSLIPAKKLEVQFIPQSATAPDKKTSPRPGVADVDTATGEFKSATSHTYGDGLIPGEQKVVLRAYNELQQPVTGLFPPEYGDLDKTPLKANTADPKSFELKVPKPAKR